MANNAAFDAVLRLDRQLCWSLYATSLAMTRLYKPLLEPLGLTYPQYLAMLALWEAERLSVGELGARLQLDSGTLTPLLKRLEAAGLVQRARNALDERVVDVSLTPAGRALKAKARAVPPAVAQASRCSSRQRDELQQRLDAVRRALLDAAEQLSAEPA